MMEPISTLGVKGLKTLASKAWTHLRDTSSEALIKKGLDQAGQTMHGAWLDACEHWLDQLEADSPALFCQLLGEDDDTAVVEERLCRDARLQRPGRYGNGFEFSADNAISIVRHCTEKKNKNGH
jgi:hypothetical protein